MPLEIRKSIKWTLSLSGRDKQKLEELEFWQPLFSADEDFGENGLQLLDYLQDVFYVITLDSIRENDLPDDERILDSRDECWEILRNTFGNLLLKINKHEDLLTSDFSCDVPNQLIRFKGKNYVDYIRKSMPDVCYSRYEIYTALKHIAPKSRHKRNKVWRCADIVCDSRIFKSFFDRSIDWIEKIQANLQTYEIENLTKLLKSLARDQPKLDDFIDGHITGRGCFSLTHVMINGSTLIDLLCFSGAKNPKESLNAAIDKIVNCGIFSNPQLVKIQGGIRFSISKTKFITLGEAILSGLYSIKNYGRMFSCCERKTFADFDWSTCKCFRMIVRYKSCELCTDIVDMYTKKYNGFLEDGKPTKSLARLQEFNELAEKIYRKFHPLLLPTSLPIGRSE